jgi:hypothetical protein
MGSEIDVTERRHLKHKQVYSSDFSAFLSVGTVLNNDRSVLCSIIRDGPFTRPDQFWEYLPGCFYTTSNNIT